MIWKGLEKERAIGINLKMVKHYRYYERVQPHAARTMKEKEPSSQEEMLIKQLEEISPKQLLKEISGGAEATKAGLADR